MATNATIDLLSTQSDVLAVFLDRLAEARATGQPDDAGILLLDPIMLDPAALEPIANKLAEEFARKGGGPVVDKLMLLSEQGEMLASLQKEYYVIHNRHERIGRASRSISGMKHAGSDKGVVRGRIKQAGGSY